MKKKLLIKGIIPLVTLGLFYNISNAGEIIIHNNTNEAWTATSLNNAGCINYKETGTGYTNFTIQPKSTVQINDSLDMGGHCEKFHDGATTPSGLDKVDEGGTAEYQLTTTSGISFYMEFAEDVSGSHSGDNNNLCLNSTPYGGLWEGCLYHANLGDLTINTAVDNNKRYTATSDGSGGVDVHTNGNINNLTINDN